MNAARSARVSAFGRLVFVPLVAGSCLAWWLIGDDVFAESGGSDYALRIPVAERHAVAVGLVGVIVASVVALDLMAYWRHRRSRSPVVLALSAAVVGGLVGAGLRLATARVEGANIGGAGVMVTGPVVLLPVVAGLGVWAGTVARTGR